MIKWLIGMHGLAIFVVGITAIPLISQVILIILILFSLIFYLKQEKAIKIYTLRYSTALGWEMTNSENEFQLIEILPTTVLSPYLVFLHYKINNNNYTKQKKLYVLIAKDTLSNDDFRKLRVELRISGLGESHQ
ncbi:MAG: protein YgfX [Methylococcaceae bacterium]